MRKKYLFAHRGRVHSEVYGDCPHSRQGSRQAGSGPGNDVSGISFVPLENVYDNVAWGLEVQGVEKAKRDEIVEHYLKLVHLWDFRNNLPSELSGGMKQRISLARVLAFNPDALLMDEPFGALDAQTREKMQVELQRIWQESNKSVMFVTHDIDEAVFLSDIVVVFSGRPAVIKEIIEIDFARPRQLDVHKTQEFMDIRNHIWDLLHQEHSKSGEDEF